MATVPVTNISRATDTLEERFRRLDSVSIHFDENDCVVVIMWNGSPDGQSDFEKLRDRVPRIAKKLPPGNLIRF